MGKIKTKNYGIKNILFIERINGTNYYHAQISTISSHMRYRVDGIIDISSNEIVPFGEMELLKEIRVINNNTFIIDYKSLLGDYGVCDAVYGSKLYQVTDKGTNLLCESNAYIMKYIDNANIVIGANYLDDSVCADDCYSYPIKEYIYHIDRHQIVASRKIYPTEAFKDPIEKQITKNK